jgi:glycosyltransferase involved in cell wall biosynthesis
MPLSLVEAMLCRRLPVVTDIAGHSEIILDGINGFIARAATAEFLDDAMERAWKCRNNWQKLGTQAGDDIRQIFPSDPVRVFADRLESLYASLARNTRKNP